MHGARARVREVRALGLSSILVRRLVCVSSSSRLFLDNPHTQQVNFDDVQDRRHRCARVDHDQAADPSSKKRWVARRLLSFVCVCSLCRCALLAFLNAALSEDCGVGIARHAGVRACARFGDGVREVAVVARGLSGVGENVFWGFEVSGARDHLCALCQREVSLFFD